MARSKCTSCGELFSSEYSFSKHRTGSYGTGTISNNGTIKYVGNDRRCLSDIEMQTKGLIKNERGIWSTAEFDASVFNKKKEGEQ